ARTHDNHSRLSVPVHFSSPLYLPAGFRVKEYHAIARCGKDLSIGTKDEIVKLSTDENLFRQQRGVI
ncbi:MAG: hypothetical protein AABY92_03885, partial [Thermodesulfobacteriota bacterium]